MSPHTCDHPQCPNPTGLCQCGCGMPTLLSYATILKRGLIRDHPIRFVHGHHLRTEKIKSASAKGRLESPISVAGKSGEQNPAWKGGRTINHDGYVWVKKRGHPRANSGGYVSEHTLVLEEQLGRPLLPNEIGHHKNGIRSDNRPENLEAMDKSEHTKFHALKQWKRTKNLGFRVLKPETK